MDNLSRSGRGSAPKQYDSDSSSESSSESSTESKDLDDPSAKARESSRLKKGNISPPDKKEKLEDKAPWMNARPQGPQPIAASLDWPPLNPFAEDAPDQPATPNPKIQTTLDNIPLVTTSTITTTVTLPVAPATNPMTLASRSPTTNAKGKLAGASTSSPKVPGLQLTGNLSTVARPDPTETPKSSRSARGEKNSSDLLNLEPSQLLAMGQGRHDLRLPEFNRISKFSLAKSESLAAQLVIGESKWFQDKLVSSKADTMLRGTVWLVHPSPKDTDKSKKVNAVESLLQPFINHHIKRSQIPTLLQTIKTNYENGVAEKAIPMYRKIRDKMSTSTVKGKHFENDPEAKALMEPLIKPLIDFLQGKDGTLRTSGFPAPLLNLLIHLADWTKKWHQANSSLEPEAFKTAQINALKAFVSTRSFMTDFTLELKEEIAKANAGDPESADDTEQQKKKLDDDYYMPLLAFLNHSVTKTLESFLDSIVDATDETRKRVQRMANIAELNIKRSDGNTERLLDETSKKAKERKPKLMTQIKDALRGSGKEESPAPPRARLRRAGTLNAKAPAPRGEEKASARTEKATVTSAFTEDAVRELQTVRKREAKLHTYFSEIKRDVFGGKIDGSSFPEWVDITKNFLKKISHGSRSDNQAFLADPDKVFSAFLTDFVRDRVFHSHTLSDGLRELQEAFMRRGGQKPSSEVNEKEKS